PNPKFPFLGVHFTRMIDGEIEAGPNAVLGFKREGYKKSDFSPRDLTETLTYPGFWKLASKFMKEGIVEYVRSFSKSQFTKILKTVMHENEEDNLIPSPAGVRTQALKSNSAMVYDFFIVK